MSEAKYKRVLLKVSGEALAGDDKFGLNHETISNICDDSMPVNYTTGISP